MRYIFFPPVVFLYLILTQCRNQESQFLIQELPGDFLINEVISSVVILDSLNGSNFETQRIIIPDIYSIPKWNKNESTRRPPTPPSLYGYSFDEIFEYFNSLNDPKQRLADSIFIVRQIDTALIHTIFDNVSALFKNENNDYYLFSLPIFSYDKRTAIITYSVENYVGYRTVLRRVDDNWVRVDHISTCIQ